MYSAGKLKETIDNLRLPVLKEAGIISGRDLKMLDLYRRSYTPGQDDHYFEQGKADEYYNSETYVELVLPILESEINKNLNQQNEAFINYLTGIDSGNSIDTADWNKYEAVKDLFRKEPTVTDLTNSVFQAFLFSSKIPPTGRGKTATMYWLAEVAQTVYPDIEIVTNNPNDPFRTTPECWDDLVEEIKEHDGQMLVLLDEAKQFLMYADQKAGKSVSQMLALLRHNNTHLIGVAHTGADVPADIRRQIYFINKRSDKKGVIGYGIDKKGDSVTIDTELMTLSNIPMTTINYGGKEPTPAINIKFDCSDEEKEDWTQCKANTNDGHQCPNKAKYPSENPLVCANHRHKMDEFTEDD